MRGLNVYCCPNCGHYGFFQLVANAVCPHCSIAMTPLPIPYQDFMDLDYPQRQILISRHMINLHPDISKDSDKETLYQEVLALREKNEQLEQTISWMHDLIWKLTRQLHIT